MKIRLEHLPADVIGLSELSREALAAGSAGGLTVPRRVADLERPAERHDRGERGALAQAIERGLAPLEPPERALTSLRVLANPGTAVVIAGQQPGFLAAPLYTLYKAMQACRLANELSGTWGTPVVPVFWNHADDHDIAEVHHAWLLNRNLDLQKIVLPGLSSGRQPLSRIVLDEEHQRLGAVRSQIAQTLGEHPRAIEALELLFPRHGETFPRALTRALTALLGEHGLVVVEPDWIRAPLSRALADLVALEPQAALQEGSGAAPAIDPTSAALVYSVDERGRRPLRAGGDGFRYDDESGSRNAAELAAEIVERPDDWSAGALLRPIVQDAVFPVCAYVGGWGELGYHTQLGPLRDLAQVPRTPFVPRVSCTIVEPDVHAALDKQGTTLRAVLAGGGVSEDEGAAPDAPPVLAQLRQTAEDAARALLARRGELAQVEPSLAIGLKRAADQVRGAVERVLQKAERVHANKSGKGRRQLRRVNNSLVPRGQPQERVLGPLGFTARHGRAWIEALYAELPAISTEHLAVYIEDESE